MTNETKPPRIMPGRKWTENGTDVSVTTLATRGPLVLFEDAAGRQRNLWADEFYARFKPVDDESVWAKR